MKPISFVAESVVDAVGQIRSRLGPEAVVLKVRKVPSRGILRLWQRPRIEVLAWVPAENCPTDEHVPASESISTFVPGIGDEPRFASLSSVLGLEAPVLGVSKRTGNRFAMPGPRHGEWQSPPLLERMGLTSLNTERLLEHLQQKNEGIPPGSLRDELSAIRDCLKSLWKPFSAGGRGTKALIGPPGAGKTTVLCKWLTNAVLLEGASARVWRLDVPRANSSETLGVHCEILNVPVERSWRCDHPRTEDYQLIDFPGVETADVFAMATLKSKIEQMEVNSLSLVLNAAYDIDLLQSQVRAFADLPVTDLIFTHLDEERRWSRLWNFVLGTKFPISFLSAGQNVPGYLVPASPMNLFPREMSGL